MAVRELQLVPGTLATDCYPSSPQIIYNEMFQKGVALSDDTNSIIVSDTQPDPNDRDKPWLKLQAPGGAPVISLPFIWYNGAWVARHPYPPEGDVRILWVGTTVDLETFDGGTAGTVGLRSGPMWEVDTDFAGRVPIGVGTIPGRTLTPTSLTVGQEAGEAEHTQTIAEMPSHNHGPPSTQPATQIDRDAGNLGIGLDSTNTLPNADQTWTATTGGGSPFNVLPPVRAIYLIKRTARIYYVG